MTKTSMNKRGTHSEVGFFLVHYVLNFFRGKKRREEQNNLKINCCLHLNLTLVAAVVAWSLSELLFSPVILWPGGSCCPALRCMSLQKHILYAKVCAVGHPRTFFCHLLEVKENSACIWDFCPLELKAPKNKNKSKATLMFTAELPPLLEGLKKGQNYQLIYKTKAKHLEKWKKNEDKLAPQLNVFPSFSSH